MKKQLPTSQDIEQMVEKIVKLYFHVALLEAFWLWAENHYELSDAMKKVIIKSAEEIIISSEMSRSNKTV